MIYDVYYDESKKNGYWHGLLLVPKDTRQKILEYLENIRQKTGYPHYITFKKLGRRGRISKFINLWLQLGVNALAQDLKGKPLRDERQLILNEINALDQDLKGKPLRVYYPQRANYTNYNELIQIENPLKAKFILFREKDSHSKMNYYSYPDYTSKIETTLRMALKGGLHYLFSRDNPIVIGSIHTDGWKHYGRHLDEKRIIGRLQSELQDYCRFAEGAVIDDSRGDHTKARSQGYNDYQLLQLTDLLIGAFRVSLCNDAKSIQKEVSWPAKKLIKKWRKGPARMQNSRWNKGFWITACRFNDDGGISFTSQMDSFVNESSFL